MVALAGCAAHTALTPVGEGTTRANVSFGGPLVSAFDTRIPIPYLTAGASYGLRGDLDLHGTLHLLPLAYGLAGLDLGATWFPVANDGWTPAVGLGGRLMTFVSLKSDVDERVRIYPYLSATAAWRQGPGLLFLGADLAIPFTRPDYDPEAVHVILSPSVGYRWDLGASMKLVTELKVQAINVRSDRLAADYVKIGGHGALTPLVALEF